jgi:hypothetical protein
MRIGTALLRRSERIAFALSRFAGISTDCACALRGSISPITLPADIDGCGSKVTGIRKNSLYQQEEHGSGT